MENQKDIGTRIKKAREAAGLTQEQLGQLVGYSAMGISYLEKGIRKIKIEHLERIAPALKVSLSYFLEPIVNMSHPNTTYARMQGDIEDDRKKEINKKIADFDKHVEELLKENK